MILLIYFTNYSLGKHTINNNSGFVAEINFFSV